MLAPTRNRAWLISITPRVNARKGPLSGDTRVFRITGMADTAECRIGTSPMLDLVGSPAEIYERHSVPRFGLSWARDLVDLVAPAAGERVLDVACGTGAVTRLVAERVGAQGSVLGLDIDAAMLAVARSVVTHPNVAWREASVMALPFDTGRFDLVLCQQGLQFFSDRLQALGEMRRVLRPDGRIGVSCWRSAEESPAYAAIEQALGRRFGRERSALPRFALSDEAQMRVLIEDAGFRAVRIHNRTMLVDWPSTTLFVRAITAGAPTMMGALGEQDDAVLSAIAAEVEAEMGVFLREGGGLRFPMGNRHVIACA
jgi:ubiquinone/menaquinone biosynthesis C-methylase UbiE